MVGKLYGLGIGPGDPELITKKALRIIEESDIILVPGTKKEDSVAYRIAKKAYERLDEKEIVTIPMPMTKEKEILKKSHEEGAEIVEKLVKQGKQVAFLTLGDPTVYSTYLYIHKRMVKKGFETEIISGITSFCAVAARLNIGLVEKAEPLHIIPASYQIEEALELPGTKVLMKAGKNITEVKKILQKKKAEIYMIENCGMDNERIYNRVEEIPEDAGYYSLIIVKESKKEQ